VFEVLDVGKHLSEKAKKDFKHTRCERGESVCLAYGLAEEMASEADKTEHHGMASLAFSDTL
jgi:hypothetical protein